MFGWAPDLEFESGVRKMEAFGSTLRVKEQLRIFRERNMREWQKKLGLDTKDDDSDADYDPTPKKAAKEDAKALEAKTPGQAEKQAAQAPADEVGFDEMAQAMGGGDDEAMMMAMMEDPAMDDPEMAFMQQGPPDDEEMAFMRQMETGMGFPEETPVKPSAPLGETPKPKNKSELTEEQKEIIKQRKAAALEKEKLRRQAREKARNEVKESAA
jgi:hypothetical protein